MNKETIIRADIVAINNLIKSREVSAIEVTKACISQAERSQSLLNCFISLESESALTQAEEIDKKISEGNQIGPLAGIPLAHKDMYYRKGKVSTCGSKIRKDWVADRTATVLDKL